MLKLPFSVLEGALTYPRRTEVASKIVLCPEKYAYDCVDLDDQSCLNGGGKKCNFGDIIEYAKKSTELRSSNLLIVTLEIILALKRHQHRLISENIDGYIFKYGDSYYLYLENVTERDPLTDNILKKYERVCVIDVMWIRSTFI